MAAGVTDHVWKIEEIVALLGRTEVDNLEARTVEGEKPSRPTPNGGVVGTAQTIRVSN